MAKQFKYTDNFAVSDSDVIAAVYYNKRTYELFVVTNRDDAYGYSNVPQYLFNHFKSASSKGHFWNTAVKGTYSNFSRGETVFFVDDRNVGAPVTARPVAQSIFTAPANDAEYVVKYAVQGVLTITGTADSIEDAIKKANKIVEEQFDGSAQVSEVTRKFV